MPPWRVAEGRRKHGATVVARISGRGHAAGRHAHADVKGAAADADYALEAAVRKWLNWRERDQSLLSSSEVFEGGSEPRLAVGRLVSCG